MLQWRGNLATEGSRGHAGGNIVCPIHRWTYLQRRAAGRTAFRQDPGLNLPNYGLREWNGLLFEDNGRDIACRSGGHGRARRPVVRRLRADHVEMHECNYNWKTFIEVYLEDYHVGPFHPGLGNFVTRDDLRWEFSKDYSVQTVGGAHFRQARPGGVQKWHEVLLATRAASRPSAAPSG